MDNLQDKRKEPRFQTDWPVFLRSGEKSEKIGDVTDISLSGIKVILYSSDGMENAPESYDLFLHNDKDPNELLNITGRIVWSVKSEDTLILGLELGNIEEETRNTLKDYIDHKDDLSIQMDLEI